MEKKDQENIKPVISDLKLKSYFCPHCNKFLMKGDVKKLNMTCPHCQKLINADEDELLKPETLNGKMEE